MIRTRPSPSPPRAASSAPSPLRAHAYAPPQSAASDRAAVSASPCRVYPHTRRQPPPRSSPTPASPHPAFRQSPSSFEAPPHTSNSPAPAPSPERMSAAAAADSSARSPLASHPQASSTPKHQPQSPDKRAQST